MAEVVWTKPAYLHLRGIAEYIALDKPSAAERLVRQSLLQARQLGSFPNLGRQVPEVPRSIYRQLWVPPRWIYYRSAAHDHRVIILHVRRAKRPLHVEDLAIE